MVRKLLSACLLGGCGVLAAADIAFTGGEDGAGTDLADAANWAGGALPGAEDVAVVDLSRATSGATLTCSADLALGGLVLTNLTASTATLQSERTLTLGAQGFSVHVQGVNLAARGLRGVEFKLPLATAAAQTWTFNKMPARFHSTIAGTAGLTISTPRGVWHYKAPGYGGKITYAGVFEWNNAEWSKPTQINYYEPLKWANEIATSSSVRFLFRGPFDLADVFPGMFPDFVSNASFGLEQVKDNEGPTNGRPDLTLATGERVQVNDFVVGGGTLTQEADAAFTGKGIFHVGNVWYYNYTYNAPCLFFLNGGAFTFAQARIGMYGRGDTRFAQAGGTATVTGAFKLGGGNQTSRTSLAEYSLRDGSMAVDGWTYLDFVDTQMGFGRALLEICGGTYSTHGFAYAPNAPHTTTEMFYENNNGPFRVSEGYSLIVLEGGELKVGAGGFKTGFNWNWRRDEFNRAGTNAYYDVRLKGGRLTACADFSSTLAMQLAGPGGSVEWNTGGFTNHVAAPVFGAGDVRKTGAGQLKLADATAFTGRLAVEEGSVMVSGDNASAAPFETGDDCWVWRADDLLAVYAHGAAISNWTDSVHGLAISNCVLPRTEYYGGPVASAVPTLLADSKMNGHAAVHFAASGLALPGSLNPFAGDERISIVLVAWPSMDGQGDGTGHMLYQGKCLLGGMNGGFRSDVNPQFHFMQGNRFCFGRSWGQPDAAVRALSRPDRDLKNAPHVLVGTVDREKISLMVDGSYSTTNAPPSLSNWKLFRRTNGDQAGAATPLYLGVSLDDDKNISYCGPFDVAELRIFKNRALTLDEQTTLTRELLAKYAGDAHHDLRVQFEREAPVAGLCGMKAPAVPSIGALPVPDQVWQADALAGTLADGAAVNAWATTAGAPAAAPPPGRAAPAFAARAFGAHAGVRFTGADQTALALPFSQMTRPDWNNWSCAFVFRTTKSGLGHGSRDDGLGLVSCENDAGMSNNGFSVNIVTNGQLTANTAGMLVDDRRPLRLDDGLPHVVVFCCDSDGLHNGQAQRLLMVDGVLNAVAGGPNPELDKNAEMNLNFGRLYGTTGFFTGDLAEFAWYGTARGLTYDQMVSVSRSLAAKYGIRLYDEDAYATAPTPGAGLGATNVFVAAGAALLLPSTDTAPYTVGTGVAFELAGTVKGTLAFADGGTLRVSRAVTGRVDRLVAAGEVNIEVREAPYPLPTWTPVCAAASFDIAHATWRVAGHRGAQVKVDNGVLSVRTTVGTMLIVR